jgi:hypothetical protein
LGNGANRGAGLRAGMVNFIRGVVHVRRESDGSEADRQKPARSG